MNDPVIRPFQPEDLPAVLQVLRAALGETPVLKRSPDLWAWKHEINPFGPSLVFVAEVDGQLAGVRAMMRWDLLTPLGDTLRCLRPVDTATHPDFGRRGIFKSLTVSAVSAAEADGIDLIFNTPNTASGPGYLKMGWQEVGPIGVMVRPLLRRGKKATDTAAPDPGAFFSSEVDEPSLDVVDRPPLGLRTPRTPEYIEWRFRGHPTARYRQVRRGDQTAFLRPNLRAGRKEIVISELFGNDPGSAVRAAARIGRAAYMAGWFSKGAPERRGAILGGLIPVPKVRALTLMAKPLRPLPVEALNLGNWDFTLGDLELL
jgi:predicted N-acetyltransferase YhbS